jgi:hypothetical protein
MEILFALALMAVLLLPIELFRFPSSGSGRVADSAGPWELGGDREQPGAVLDGRDDTLEMTVEWGLFTRAFIQQRLEALAEELERLDREPDIFAKAFHLTAARSAYQALLVDASRLSHEPSRYAVQSLDFELVESSTYLGEELQL